MTIVYKFLRSTVCKSIGSTLRPSFKQLAQLYAFHILLICLLDLLLYPLTSIVQVCWSNGHWGDRLGC